jgi:uncharacterized membrane protein (DUF373 family)
MAEQLGVPERDAPRPEPPSAPKTPERAQFPAFLRLNGLIRAFEDIFHYAVALLLLAIGVLVLYHTVSSLFGSGSNYATRTVDGINGVLLAIIVLELMSTVVAHFERAGLQLKPFLIIGIISAVRHILTIGARLTLEGEVNGVAFRNSQIELGVETGVVLGLAIGLLLVRRGETTLSDRVEDD